MKTYLLLLNLGLLAALARAHVHVFVEDIAGKASVKYECTAGEVVRAFAIDVTVDQGQIIGVSDFFVGESRADAQGYGIFPASFRDHITFDPGANINWDVSQYTPLAAVEDPPTNALPGLYSSGVTLEFGGLWDPAVPAAVPGPAGTLCTLQISEAAYVSVAANLARGGLVSASPETTITPRFTGSPVDPGRMRVFITEVTLVEKTLTILFRGGELETAPTVDGPWTGTGNSSGQYLETLAEAKSKYFRVRGP